MSFTYVRSDMSSYSNLAQQYASKPGAYDLLIRNSKPILDRGDKVQFEVYISGYGVVESASIYIAPSWSIFSLEESKIAAGDSLPQPWDLLGTLVSFDDKAFFDATGRYQISTECKTLPPASKAPITLDMKINPKAVPGVYSLHFILKYYNGESWNNRSAYTNLTVRNFYQRNEVTVWVIGGIAAFLTIISWCYPLIKWLYHKLVSFL